MHLKSTLASQMSKAFGLYDILKWRDSLTAEHSLNVACLTKILVCDYINADMGKDKAFIAGLLHDIGKIKMPDFVFRNYVLSSQEDKDIIRQHPIYTKAILENTGFDNEIITTAYQHHERFDGSGYPSGIKENDITPTARILSIVDSFSAITEDRPYREGQPIKRAVEILLEEKELFDVSMLTAFIKNINQVVHAAGQEMNWYKHALLKRVN